jgi:hypothetical protein
LHPEGHFLQRCPSSRSEQMGFHDILMQRARQRLTEKDAPWDIS